MYLSSPEDTAKREVDEGNVGTILFTPIRPEFRGPVRRCCVALAAFASLANSGPLAGRVFPRLHERGESANLLRGVLACTAAASHCQAFVYP
jgi:hypothetical protein